MYDQVFDGYEDVYSHTETWTEQEKTGEKRLVSTTYTYFGKEGIYALVAFAHLMCIGKFSIEHYNSVYDEIVTMSSNLSSFPSSITQEKINKYLSKNMNVLFSDDFNKKIVEIAL